MDTNKLEIKINNRRILKESLRKDIDSRLDELLGRRSSAAATTGGAQRGALGAWWKKFKDERIGTRDDYRFGYRKGYLGKQATMASKDAAMYQGVANPDYDPDKAAEAAKRGREYRVPERVFGQSAWDVAKRQQKDYRLEKGRATWGDQFKMAWDPKKFGKDYTARTGGTVPGFDQEGPMKPDYQTRWGRRASGQPVEKSPGRRYMDVTDPIRKDRLNRELAQSQRLAGDPDAVEAFRVRARARAKEAGTPVPQYRTYRKPGEEEPDAPEDYPWTRGVPVTDKHGMPTGEMDKGAPRTKRGGFWGGGISWSGRPINRGGKPWHSTGRQEVQQVDATPTTNPNTPVIRPGGGSPVPVRPKDPDFRVPDYEVIDPDDPKPKTPPRGADDPPQLPPGPKTPPRGADDSPRPRLRMRQHPKTKRLKQLGTSSRKARQEKPEKELSWMERWNIMMHGDPKNPKGKGRGPWDTGHPGGMIGNSTIYTGSPLSEMLRRRLRHA